MTESVQSESLKSWVAEQDLQRAAGGGVSFADDRQVGSDVIEHALEPRPQRLKASF